MKNRNKMTENRITENMILKSVASSTAIDTNEEIKGIEKKLKKNNLKYKHLSLAL